MSTLSGALLRLRQRLGVCEELIAGIVLAALAVGGISFTLITHTGTPAGAALTYMAAVDRADTDYVWSHSIIDSAHTSTANVSLLDRAALAAQLKATAHTRSRFTLQGVASDNAGPKVTLSYNTSSGKRTTSLVLRGRSPHSWPVLLEPAGLDLNIPPGAGSLAIDGQTIDAKGGNKLMAAVFPGRHKLSLDASALYLAYADDLDAEPAFPRTTAVSLANVKLTDQAASDAKTAASKAIRSCASATVLRPADCQQSYTKDTATGGVTWSLLGDPSDGANVKLNDRSKLQLTGHYLMQLSYDSAITHGARVIAVGGSYAATLSWDGQAISVSGFDPEPPATSLPQPAAADAQVLAGLKPQFDSCLTIQAGAATGCPQRVAAFYASNFIWHANAEPLQGAAVAWDAAQGFYRVTGSYDFTVDYDSNAPYTPTRHFQDRASGQYIADLYWDGSKGVFVGFEK